MATYRDHFLSAIIDADLEAGRVPGVVTTRFPPEPNGFLHIGHAKSICLNFGLARRYGGKCFLRFDDTNPLKEEAQYVRSIEEDVRWLGFEPAEGAARFASDYFEQLYGFARELVSKGLAFVCSQSADDLRRDRGTPYEVGVDSPDRDRPRGESLDLFERMKNGEFPDGAYTVRARIDMAHPNLVMRDPTLYRIRHAHHHRQGDGWCIYPMYDFAHCLEDAIEGITHSICTLEFESNRALYDWVLDNVTPPSRPRQYEFARLSLDYTITSKRKLLLLVDEGHVAGWDDPRMPTLAGLRRRGVTAEALRAFSEMVGVAKNNSTVDLGKFEYCVRDDLNTRAPRLLGVLRPLRAFIEGLPGDEMIHDAAMWPREIDQQGSRALSVTPELLVESEDFAQDPPKGWKRLTPGRQVRLRHGPVIRCEGLDDQGVLRCTYIADEDAERGIGVLHWVSESKSVAVEVRLYDRLFAHPAPGDDFLNDLNPESLIICPNARIEPFDLPERFQLERLGYFCLDPDSTQDRPVLNRIVTLKDSWTKTKAAAAPAGPKAQKQAGDAPKKELDDAGRHYVSEYGVSLEHALVLAGDPELGALFEETVETGIDAKAVAPWLAGPVRRHVKEAAGVGSLRYDAAALASLLTKLEAGEITRVQAKEGLEGLASTGELPSFDSGGDLGAVLDALLVDKADELARYRGGERKLLGFFMGEAMRASKGAFDPGDVRKSLQTKLDG